MPEPIITQLDAFRLLAPRSQNYLESTRALVDAAGLQPGMDVLDLACGAGLTAVAAAERTKGQGRLILVDRDPALLAAARGSLAGRPVETILADVAMQPERLPGPVDRVLCNAAYWPVADMARVLAAVRQRLKPDGRLAFTVAGTFFDFGDGRPSPQRAFAEALSERGQAHPPPPPAYGRDRVADLLRGAGLATVTYRVVEVEGAVPDWEPGGELHTVLRLHPPAWPGHDYLERVERAMAQLQALRAAVQRRQPLWRWALFVAALPA